VSRRLRTGQPQRLAEASIVLGEIPGAILVLRRGPIQSLNLASPVCYSHVPLFELLLKDGGLYRVIIMVRALPRL
jgi:hypothetical protein